ncbi:hypothetical protein WJX77_005436 [Trebouxia sp. C0004]
MGSYFVYKSEQMTDALAKWAAALDTFDSVKHNFRAPGQVEKALNSIALDERVLLFRGSDSDIVERLSPYDQVAVVIVEDTSEMHCEAMLQPTLPALPLSADQLEAILFAQPVHAMPVQQDVFQSFGSSPVKQMFVVEDGSAVTLARIISTQLTFRLLLGGEPDTAYNVNSSLITLLFHLDNLANNSCQGFLPVRDKGDPDSSMTLLSGKSASLRPDGVIRSTDGRRLLMKWEEKADVLADAVEDLKVKTAQCGELPTSRGFTSGQAASQLQPTRLHLRTGFPAAHGFLHGLEALHKADFVHRDLRWANVACTTERAYFLLDLETCHWADQTPQIHLQIWEALAGFRLREQGMETKAYDQMQPGAGLQLITSRAAMSCVKMDRMVMAS